MYVANLRSSLVGAGAALSAWSNVPSYDNAVGQTLKEQRKFLASLQHECERWQRACVGE